MKYIYILGLILLGNKESGIVRHHSRKIYGLYHTFEDAEKVLLQGHFDIFEHYFNIAIIERVPILTFVEEEKVLGPYMMIESWEYHASYPNNKLEVKLSIHNNSINSFWMG